MENMFDLLQEDKEVSEFPTAWRRKKSSALKKSFWMFAHAHWWVHGGDLDSDEPTWIIEHVILATITGITIWLHCGFPHKGRWRGAYMFSLVCVWTNGWANNRDAGNLRGHHVHYGVTVMDLIWACKLWRLSWKIILFIISNWLGLYTLHSIIAMMSHGSHDVSNQSTVCSTAYSSQHQGKHKSSAFIGTFV